MTYPYTSTELDAIDRLQNDYNSGNYDVSTNPYGFGQGGHRQNFVPALADVATVGEGAADAAAAAASSASAAATSETNAAASAAKLSGTSTTSLSIGTGSKSLTTQSGKFFNVGAYVSLRSAANPSVNYMVGYVSSYSGTSLTVNVTKTGGSGTFADWNIYITGEPGATGNTGSQGATGTMPAVQWGFSTGISDDDPGNGLFKFSNATVASINFVYFDNLDHNGSDLTAWLDRLDDSTNTSDRGTLTFIQASDQTKFIAFKVTGAVVDGTGYRKVPVTAVSYSAASVPFGNAEPIGVAFSPTGNKGTDGAGAGDVIGPSGATDGALPLWDTSTGKLIKDSGVGIGTSGNNVPKCNTANTFSAAQAINAKLDAQQDVYLTGVLTPSQITSDQNDYNPSGLSTAGTLRISSDAERTITGLAGGADGRVLILSNIGSYPIMLTNQDSNSTAANRFLCEYGLDVVIYPEGVAFLLYDNTSGAWRVSMFGKGAQYRLTQDTTFYAAASGSASNTGLSSGSPWPLQYALDQMALVDARGHEVTISFTAATHVLTPSADDDELLVFLYRPANCSWFKITGASRTTTILQVGASAHTAPTLIAPYCHIDEFTSLTLDSADTDAGANAVSTYNGSGFHRTCFIGKFTNVEFGDNFEEIFFLYGAGHTIVIEGTNYLSGDIGDCLFYIEYGSRLVWDGQFTATTTITIDYIIYVDRAGRVEAEGGSVGFTNPANITVGVIAYYCDSASFISPTILREGVLSSLGGANLAYEFRDLVEVISRGQVNGVTSINFDIEAIASKYDEIEIEIFHLRSYDSGSYDYFYLDASTDGGSNYLAGTYYAFTTSGFGSDGAPIEWAGTDTSYIGLNSNNAAYAGASYAMQRYVFAIDTPDSSSYKLVRGRADEVSYDTEVTTSVITGAIWTTDPVTDLRFNSYNGSTFDAHYVVRGRIKRSIV